MDFSCLIRNSSVSCVGSILLLTLAAVSLFTSLNIQVSIGPQQVMSRRHHYHKVTESHRRPVKGPRNNFLVYIKIEKTGSSTVSNILSSYGYRHRLNMVMSTIPENLINTRELEPGNSWDIGPKRSPVHLIEQHARFNRKFHDKYFGGEDTLFVTSVREPVNHFISYVDFMPIYRKYDPRQVLNKDRLFYKRRHYITGMQRLIHNIDLQWLGFDVRRSRSIPAIKNHIKAVDKKFQLVMITEYFDESLVLLKRMMNWDLGDIFYAYANEATKKSGVVFTDEEKEKLLDKKHNYGDKLLYDHFNRTFWNKVATEDEFMEEVYAFKTLNKRVVTFCNSQTLRNNPKSVLEVITKWDGVFNVTDTHCIAMRLVSGAALELGSALDHYIPHRNSKSAKEIVHR